MMNGIIGTDAHGRKVSKQADGKWHIVKKDGTISTRCTTDTDILVEEVATEFENDMQEIADLLEEMEDTDMMYEITNVEESRNLSEEMETKESMIMMEMETSTTEPTTTKSMIMMEMETSTTELEELELTEIDVKETNMETFNTVKIITIKGTENVRAKLYRTNTFVADAGLYNAYEVINDSKTGKEKKQRIDNTIIKEMVIEDAQANGYIYKKKQNQTYTHIEDDMIDDIVDEKTENWNTKNPKHELLVCTVDTGVDVEVHDRYTDGTIKDATFTISTETTDGYPVEVYIYVKSGQLTNLKGYDKVVVNKMRKEA